jgi:hypothetical protein
MHIAAWARVHRILAVVTGMFRVQRCAQLITQQHGDRSQRVKIMSSIERRRRVVRCCSSRGLLPCSQFCVDGCSVNVLAPEKSSTAHRYAGQVEEIRAPISFADASADLSVFDFVECEIRGGNAFAREFPSPRFSGRVG